MKRKVGMKCSNVRMFGMFDCGRLVRSAIMAVLCAVGLSAFAAGGESGPWEIGKPNPADVVARQLIGTNTLRVVLHDVVRINVDVLSIEGTGAMKDFTEGAAPWTVDGIDVKFLQIGNGVATIGAYAFVGSGLTEVTIPSSVTGIGAGVFKGCSGLKRVTVLAAVPPSLGANVFAGCAITDIYVPAESLAAYQKADGWKAYASYIRPRYDNPAAHDLRLTKVIQEEYVHDNRYPDKTKFRPWKVAATDGYSWSTDAAGNPLLTITTPGLIVTGTTTREHIQLDAEDVSLEDLSIDVADNCIVTDRTDPTTVYFGDMQTHRLSPEGPVKLHASGSLNSCIVAQNGALTIDGYGHRGWHISAAITSEEGNGISAKGTLTIDGLAKLTVTANGNAPALKGEAGVSIFNRNRVEGRAGAASAIATDGKLTIGPKAGNIVLRGGAAGELGALELSSGDAVVLPEGWEILGSTDLKAEAGALFDSVTVKQSSGGKKAYTGFIGNDFARAVTFATKADVKDPADFIAWGTASDAFRHPATPHGKFLAASADDMIAKYSAAIKQDETDYEAYINRAFAYMKKVGENRKFFELAQGFGFTFVNDTMHFEGELIHKKDETPELNDVIDEICAFALPLMKNAYLDLGAVPNRWRGSVQVKPDLYPVDEEIYFDLADVHCARAALAEMLCVLNMMKGFDTTLDSDKLVSTFNGCLPTDNMDDPDNKRGVQAILENNPDFMGKVHDQKALTEAGDWWASACVLADKWDQANLKRSDGKQHFFMWDTVNLNKDSSEDNGVKFLRRHRQELANLPYFASPMDLSRQHLSSEQIMTWRPLFEGKFLRQNFPEFGPGCKKPYYNEPCMDTLPDATLAGILPGMNRGDLGGFLSNTPHGEATGMQEGYKIELPPYETNNTEVANFAVHYKSQFVYGYENTPDNPAVFAWDCVDLLTLQPTTSFNTRGVTGEFLYWADDQGNRITKIPNPFSPAEKKALEGKKYADRDYTVNAKFDLKVTYIDYDEDGEPFERTEPCVILEYDMVSFETGKVYAVMGDVALSESASPAVNSTPENPAKIVLCDGATLTTKRGLRVKEGNALEIYGQAEGTGTLVAMGMITAGNAGIGGNCLMYTNGFTFGSVTINGGTVKAEGNRQWRSGVEYCAPGIGGGLFKENTGTVKIGGIATVVTGVTEEVTAPMAPEDYEKDHSARYVSIQVLPPGSSRDNPWKIGTPVRGDVLAWRDGAGKLVIEGTGAITNLSGVVGLKDLLGTFEEVMIGEGVTDAAAEAFAGADGIVLTLPVGWQGGLPDAKGNWYGATGVVLKGSEDAPWIIGNDGAEPTPRLVEAYTNGSELVIQGKGTITDLSEIPVAVKGGIAAIEITKATVTDAEANAFAGFRNVKVSLPDGWQGELPNAKGDWYGATGVTLLLPGDRENPWVIGKVVTAYTNGTEFVIEGVGTITDLSKIADSVKDGIEELTITEATVTGAEANAFAGFDNVVLTLPDGWQGAYPDVDGNWYGATGVKMAGSEEAPWVVGNDGETPSLRNVEAWTNGTEFVIAGAGTITDLSRVTAGVKGGITEITIAEATVTGAAEDAFAGFDSVVLSLPDGWQGRFPGAMDNWYGATNVSLAELGNKPCPWLIGQESARDELVAYTNGTTLVVKGEGDPKQYKSGEEPWAGADITKIKVPYGRAEEFKTAWPEFEAFIEESAPVITTESDEFAVDLRPSVELVADALTVSNITWSATAWGKVPESETTGISFKNESTGATGVLGTGLEGEDLGDFTLPAKDGEYVLTHSTGGLLSFVTFKVSGTGCPVGSESNPWVVGDDTVAWTDGNGNVYFKPPRCTVSRTGLETVAAAMGGVGFPVWLVSADDTATNGLVMVIGASGAQYKTLGEVLAAGEESCTLYDVEGCVVNYDGRGAAGEMKSDAFLPGVPTNLTANAYTAFGYTFQGWTTNDGTKVVFKDKAKIDDPQAGDVYGLQAVWKVAPVTVKTFDQLTNALAAAAQQGAGLPVTLTVSGTITVPYGEKVEVPGDPAKAMVHLKGSGTIKGYVKTGGNLDVGSVKIAPWSVGNGVTAYIDADGTLHVEGKGKMKDFTDADPAPWAGVVSDIKAVEVAKGVTKIGDAAFEALDYKAITKTLTFMDEAHELNLLAFVSADESVTNAPEVEAFRVYKNATKRFEFAEAFYAEDTEMLYGSVSEALEEGETSLRLVTLEDVKDIHRAELIAAAGEKPYSKAMQGLLDEALVKLDKAKDYGAVIDGYDERLSQIEQQADKDKSTAIAGTDITWRVMDGTLVIEGEGEMPDFVEPAFTNGAPWNVRKDDITNATVAAGIAPIGDAAFAVCPAFEESAVLFRDPALELNLGAFACGSATNVPVVKVEIVTEDGRKLRVAPGGWTDADEPNVTYDSLAEAIEGGATAVVAAFEKKTDEGEKVVPPAEVEEIVKTVPDPDDPEKEIELTAKYENNPNDVTNPAGLVSEIENLPLIVDNTGSNIVVVVTATNKDEVAVAVVQEMDGAMSNDCELVKATLAPDVATKNFDSSYLDMSAFFSFKNDSGRLVEFTQSIIAHIPMKLYDGQIYSVSRRHEDVTEVLPMWTEETVDSDTAEWVKVDVANQELVVKTRKFCDYALGELELEKTCTIIVNGGSKTLGEADPSSLATNVEIVVTGPVNASDFAGYAKRAKGEDEGDYAINFVCTKMPQGYTNAFTVVPGTFKIIMGEKLLPEGVVTYPKAQKDGYLKQKATATWKAKATPGSVFAGWVPADGAPAAVTNHLDLSWNELRDPKLSFKVATGEQIEPADVVATWARIDEDLIESVAIDANGLYVETKSHVTATVSGLPNGLRFNAKTLAITGTVKAKDKTYKVKVSVKNASGYTWKQTFGFVVEGNEVKAVVPAEDCATTGVAVLVRCDPAMGSVKGTGVYALKLDKKTGIWSKQVAINATAKSGYVFAGWYLDPGFSEPAYALSAAGNSKDYRQASQSIVVTGPTYLFARFVAKTTKADPITHLRFNGAGYCGADAGEFAETETWYQGVALPTNGCAVAFGSLSLPTVTVSGLPAGVKYDKLAQRFTGVPTACSTAKKPFFTVKISVKNKSGATDVLVKNVYVEPLPKWAVGNFDGYHMENGTTNGTFAATVGSKGKVSGKTKGGLAATTFSAKSFASVKLVEGALCYIADVTVSYKDPLTKKTVKEPDTFYVMENPETGLGMIGGGDKDGNGCVAVQRAWDRKDLALPAFPTGKKALALELDSGITLKFGAKGKVTLAGKVTGDNGKSITVSGTTYVLPIAWLGPTCLRTQVYVYVAPKANFADGVSEVYDVYLTVGADGKFDDASFTPPGPTEPEP